MIQFHRREQALRRIGGAMVVTLLAFSLLGAGAGSGLLSTATPTGRGHGVVVEYQRFVHRVAHTTLQVTVAGRLVKKDSLDVALAGRWIESVDIRGITPQPSGQIQTADEVVLRLLTRPGATLTVGISYRLDTNGPVSGWVRAAGATASLDQLIYP